MRRPDPAHLRERPAGRRVAGRADPGRTIRPGPEREHRPADSGGFYFQGQDRRAADLQRSSDAGPDPGGHEHADRRAPAPIRSRRRRRRIWRDGGEHAADQPELDGVDGQRRRDRLPGRALPGRGLHELRADRARRRDDASATPACSPTRATATACARPTPPATSSGYSSDRERDDAGAAGHDSRRRRRAGLTATPVEHDPDRPELDGVDRQRRRDRLPGRALPGRGLHATSRRSRTPTGRRSATPAWRAHDLPYRVRAVDAAGNLSRYSAIATRDHAGAAGHDAADGARRAGGDGGRARRRST